MDDNPFLLRALLEYIQAIRLNCMNIFQRVHGTYIGVLFKNGTLSVSMDSLARHTIMSCCSQRLPISIALQLQTVGMHSGVVAASSR